MYSYSHYSSAFRNVLILALIISVVTLVAMWKIFEKAGYAGWKALIPLYNAYCLFEMTWGNGWQMLLCLIPLVNIVILILAYYKLAQAFGQGAGFTAGLIFLSIVFFPLLAFGNYEYQGIPTKN